MKTMEYAWLTSALRVKDGFLGSGNGLPLPFLFRHGVGVCTRPESGFTLADVAEHIRTGGRQFILSAKGPGGVTLDMASSYYLPDMPRNALILGSRLFEAVSERCNLELGEVVPLDARSLAAHGWTYPMPAHPEDDRASLEVYETLGIASLEEALEDEGDHGIMRRLCERYPAPEPLPPMTVILAPWLALGTTLPKSWKRDRIVLSLGKDTVVRTRHGDESASPEFFRTQPIVKFEGFLIPLAAAPCFETGSDCSWPTLTCIKQVVLEW